MYDFTIICIKGKKVGDSVIRTEDNNSVCIYPDTFYERDMVGFWMLKKMGDWWTILKFLKA